MDLELSDIEAQSTRNYNLGRLQKWLDYELSGLAFWTAAWYIFHLWFFIIIAATIAAVIFIPVLITTLLQEKRYGWITAFFISVVLLPLIAYLTLQNPTWIWIAAMTSLGFFYFYCGILRLVIREW